MLIITWFILTWRFSSPLFSGSSLMDPQKCVPLGEDSFLVCVESAGVFQHKDFMAEGFSIAC